MPPLAGVAPTLVARARADQVALAYASLPRTTLSMLLGAVLLGIAMWSVTPPTTMACWVALVLVNQLARWRLTVAWRRARPGDDACCVGATTGPRIDDRWCALGRCSGRDVPASTAHQALLIVCLFGVVLGGLNLTAIWRPSFYGFVLPALVPLIVRVAWSGDPVHIDTASS